MGGHMIQRSSTWAFVGRRVVGWVTWQAYAEDEKPNKITNNTYAEWSNWMNEIDKNDRLSAFDTSYTYVLGLGLPHALTLVG
jgi:hypothetical protein